MTKSLRNRLLHRSKYKTNEYVVSYGGRNVQRIDQAFRRAAKRAGLMDVTPHTLRHTAATWMAQKKVPMWEIAGFLGHASSKTTERVYAHHSPEHLKTAASALDFGLRRVRLRKIKLNKGKSSGNS